MSIIIEDIVSKSVRNGALDTLKGDIKPIVELLKKLEAQKLHVELMPDQLSGITGDGAQSAAADLIGDVFCIYFPSGSRAHAIFHELLHAKLSVLNGVEGMIAAPDYPLRDKQNIRWFNNDLDHVHVIRDEINAYPEALPYWEADFQILISGDSWTPSNDKHVQLQRRTNLLRGWLILPHSAPSSPTTAEYRRHLKSHGWLQRANAMHADLIKAGFNKRKAAAAFFRAIEYSKDAMCSYKKYKSPVL